MRTGDLVLMRDDGYLEIVGRIKDTIIKGGENIYDLFHNLFWTRRCTYSSSSE